MPDLIDTRIGSSDLPDDLYKSVGGEERRGPTEHFHQLIIGTESLNIMCKITDSHT